ncbi:hypothetical protein B0H13DRAFT_1857419 [Mycena leptocephala]|nr:hypothetical protein B0H13DRAFT_1857419 [Mycena leptocephala]
MMVQLDPCFPLSLLTQTPAFDHEGGEPGGELEGTLGSGDGVTEIKQTLALTARGGVDTNPKWWCSWSNASHSLFRPRLPLSTTRVESRTLALHEEVLTYKSEMMVQLDPCFPLSLLTQTPAFDHEGGEPGGEWEGTLGSGDGTPAFNHEGGEPGGELEGTLVSGDGVTEIKQTLALTARGGVDTNPKWWCSWSNASHSLFRPRLPLSTTRVESRVESWKGR